MDVYRFGHNFMPSKRFFIFLTALSLYAVPVSAQMIHTVKPDTAKKCAVCHFQWVNTFYNDQMNGDLATRPEKKQVGIREMCISCHDGSIMDSRKSLFHGFEHKIGQKPSADIRIPENFPLDLDGKMQCATCHSPHALPSDTEKPYGLFLRAKNIDSAMCLICHEDKTGLNISGNHPLNVKLPDRSAGLLVSGARKGSNNTLICETCHMAHGAPNEKLLVLPVKNTATRSVLCEACHSDRPQLSDRRPDRASHFVNKKAKTARPPETFPSDTPPGLGRNGELICMTCHKPHQAAEPAALLITNNRNSGLCISCHKIQSIVRGSSHDLGLSAPNLKNITGQTVSDTGPCAACHSAHAGKGPLLWSRPGTPTANSPCLDCHSENGPVKDGMPLGHSHQTGIKLTAEMGNTDLPLYGNDIRKSTEGTIACRTCHNVHDPLPLLRQKDKKEIRRGNFLRLSNAASTELCVDCHVSKKQIIDTGHDLTHTNPGADTTRSRSLRQAGVCFFCHTAHHAKTESFIWSAPLGSSLPNEWNTPVKNRDHLTVRFCTGCHRDNENASDTVPARGLHPDRFSVPAQIIHRTAQASKDQPLPLFTPDGKKSASGNIVCSTCHDAHQWQPLDRAPDRNRDEGNIFSSFLRPETASILCAGCHGA